MFATWKACQHARRIDHLICLLLVPQPLVVEIEGIPVKYHFDVIWLCSISTELNVLEIKHVEFQAH